MIGKRIRQAREYLGLSGKVVAEQIGIKSQSYYQVESGETQSYSNNLISFFTSQDISWDWIMTGQGDMMTHNDFGWTLTIKQFGVEKFAIDLESPDGLDFEMRRRKQNKD